MDGPVERFWTPCQIQGGTPSSVGRGGAEVEDVDLAAGRGVLARVVEHDPQVAADGEDEVPAARGAGARRSAHRRAARRGSPAGPRRRRCPSRAGYSSVVIPFAVTMLRTSRVQTPSMSRRSISQSLLMWATSLRPPLASGSRPRQIGWELGPDQDLVDVDPVGLGDRVEHGRGDVVGLERVARAGCRRRGCRPCPARSG